MRSYYYVVEMTGGTDLDLHGPFTVRKDRGRKFDELHRLQDPETDQCFNLTVTIDPLRPGQPPSVVLA